MTENMPDGDELFAYDTVKEIKVLDRRLGLVFYTVLMIIIFYIVIFVFMIKKQYQAIEKTNGWVVTKVMNPAEDAEGIPWDIFDMVTNPGEQGALFLPTKIVRTQGQQMEDFCESPDHLCKKDEDCDIGNKELQKEKCKNGHCMRRQWCPAMNEGDAGTIVSYPDIMNAHVWFQVNLHYHLFMIDVSTTDEIEPSLYPAQGITGANTYPVHDMLRMANVKMEDVKESGAVLAANMIFDCDLDDKFCSVRLEVDHIDSTTGFNYIHNHYYEDGDKQMRDTWRMYGLRIATFSTGLGKVTSFVMTVLQVSSAIALLACAQAAADVFLSSIVPERKHYLLKKEIMTEDFND